MQLLSSLLRPFEDEAVERQEKQHRERQEKEKKAKEEAEKQRALQEQEQSAAAMQPDQAQPGAPAAEASPGGSGTQQPLAAETAAVDAPRDVAGASAAAAAPAHTAQQQQEAPAAGEASGAAAAPQQQAAGQAGVSPAPAAAAAKDGAGPSSAQEPAAAGGAAAAAEPADGSGKEEEDEEQRAAEQKREEEERLHKQYMSAFDAVPLPLLLQLPAVRTAGRLSPAACCHLLPAVPLAASGVVLLAGHWLLHACILPHMLLLRRAAAAAAKLPLACLASVPFTATLALTFELCSSSFLSHPPGPPRRPLFLSACLQLMAEDWVADRPASVLKMVIQVGCGRGRRWGF